MKPPKDPDHLDEDEAADVEFDDREPGSFEADEPPEEY
jgi:hypothetical protein